MSRAKKQFKLVIVDRDGTINIFREDCTKTPEEFIPIAGALEAIALLNRAGWHVVVAANQPELDRGVIDMAAINAMHAQMHHKVAEAGGRIDAIFFCPHGPDESCNCRKPQPGLLLEIAERYDLSSTDIYVVGDSLCDMLAADRARSQPHLVCTGEGAVWRGQPLGNDFPANTQVHDDLLAFAHFLLAHEE